MLNYFQQSKSLITIKVWCIGQQRASLRLNVQPHDVEMRIEAEYTVGLDPVGDNVTGAIDEGYRLFVIPAKLRPCMLEDVVIDTYQSQRSGLHVVFWGFLEKDDVVQSRRALPMDMTFC